MFGFIPLITLYFLVPISNSTTISQSPWFTVLTICSFLIILNGLLNKTKHKASNKVDLPEPLLPTIKVVFDLFKTISIGVLPVDKKFLYFIFLKVITH